MATVAGGVAAILVLALVGAGVWWFFIRAKPATDDGFLTLKPATTTDGFLTLKPTTTTTDGFLTLKPATTTDGFLTLKPGKQQVSTKGLSWDPKKKQLRVKVSDNAFSAGASVILSNVVSRGNPQTSLEGKTGTVVSLASNALLCPGAKHPGNVMALSFPSAPYGSSQWCNPNAAATLTF